MGIINIFQFNNYKLINGIKIIFSQKRAGPGRAYLKPILSLKGPYPTQPIFT